MQRRLFGFLIIAVLAVALVACSSSDKKSSGTTAGDSASASAAGTITIKDFSFTPTTVKAGSKVTVKNDGASTHTVTADKSEFDTGPIEGGKSATFTAPSTPGTYAFHCNIHPTTMKSTLTVT